jgi:hypothetical protein
MLVEPNPTRQKPRAKTVTKSRVGVELALFSEKQPKGARKLATSGLRLSGFGPAGSNHEKRQTGTTEFHPSDAP